MIRRMGLVVHGGRPAAVAAAARVREWAASRCSAGCVDIDAWSDDPARPRRAAKDEAAAGPVEFSGSTDGFFSGAKATRQNGQGEE